MEAIKQYTEVVEKALEGLNLPHQPANLYDPIRYFMKLGGKRMRPILALMGAELFGAERSHALQAGLAVEVFHNFTLVHDDIMDVAPLRRGKETVHTKWNTNIAILAGDVMFVKAYELLAKQEGDLHSMMQVFNRTAIEVCEGQQYDMDFESRDDVTVEEYLEMIRLKTSVLLGCALQLGAITKEATEEDQLHVYNFGINVGLAFQVQDDILDLYADPEKFGKQVGGDVLSNKKTLLYLEAFKHATVEQRDVLTQLLNEQDPVLKVNRTRQIYDQIGVKQICERVMKDYHDTAMNEIAKIKVPNQAKAPLIALAEYLLNREI